MARSPETAPPQAHLPAAAPGNERQRLVAVAAEGLASGAPLNMGGKLLQGWLASSGRRSNHCA